MLRVGPQADGPCRWPLMGLWINPFPAYDQHGGFHSHGTPSSLPGLFQGQFQSNSWMRTGGTPYDLRNFQISNNIYIVNGWLDIYNLYEPTRHVDFLGLGTFELKMTGGFAAWKKKHLNWRETKLRQHDRCKDEWPCLLEDDFVLEGINHPEPGEQMWTEWSPHGRWQNQCPRNRPEVAATWSWACDREPQTSSISNCVWNAVAHACAQHDLGDPGIFKQLQDVDLWCSWWSRWRVEAERRSGSIRLRRLLSSARGAGTRKMYSFCRVSNALVKCSCSKQFQRISQLCEVFSFDDFNHSYVDALRNTSDPNHRIALDVQYRPYSNSSWVCAEPVNQGRCFCLRDSESMNRSVTYGFLLGFVGGFLKLFPSTMS